MAAAVALLIGVPLVRGPATITVVGSSDAPQMVSLPDGSRVELGIGASLQYPRRFASERRAVTLDGEARFDVESGSAPFVVEASEARVTVLGTIFSVHALGSSTWVTVEEGRVRLEDAVTPTAVIELGAGDGAVLFDSIRALPPEEVASVRGWVEGGLDFVDAPLQTVLDRLAARGWAIRAGSGVDAGTPVTVTLDGATAAEAADVLAAILGTNAQLDADGVWIIG